MGTAERREREKLEVRTKILDAARELFVVEGYDAVTMRKIAQKIDYSPTAIYFHFKDKESLLRELCHTDFQTLAHQFTDMAQIVDPLERLRSVAQAYVDFARYCPNHYRMMFMTPLPPHDPPDAALEQRGNPEEDAYAFLKEAVVQAMEAGLYRAELKDVDLLAQTLWASVHGVVSLEIAKHHDGWIDWRPLEDRTRLMVDALQRGLMREGG